MKTEKNIIKSYQPVLFQQASVEAIAKHFRDHDRALCADEAGLGKTIIARGVIEQMAREKAEGQVESYRTQLTRWWELFCEKETIYNTSSGIENNKRKALTEFVKDVTGADYDIGGGKKWANSQNANLTVQECVQNSIDQLNAQTLPDFLKRVIKLYTYGAESNKRVTWNTSLKDVSALGFRVLYVCCNLAVAEQNSRKLIPVSQCSNQGAKDKPDRLSVLWYYLENYSTPYVELYPITATLTTSDTPGNQNELNKLNELREIWKKDTNMVEAAKRNGVDLDGKIEKEKKKGTSRVDLFRRLAEMQSLMKFHPDLIIFDEFQNFTDMIHLIDMKENDFKTYLSNLPSNNAQSAQTEDDGDKQAEDDRDEQAEDDGNRKDALKRCWKIVQELMKPVEGKEPPKLLMLSATPFHAGRVKNDLNRIEYQQLVIFMAKGNPSSGWQSKTPEELEQYLYGLGIFRNERIRLMQKNNHAYHLVECDGTGLLTRAAMIGKNEGKRAVGIVKTTPELSSVDEVYKGKYSILRNSKQIPPHARYERLKDIVFAPNANDVSRTGRVREYSGSDFGQLLWIPPVTPSKPLNGIFAQYADFSKTLVFSNLRVIPLSIVQCLNRDVPVQCCNLNGIDDKIKKYLEENVFSLFPGEAKALAERFVDYLARVGGRAIGGNPSEQKVIEYIEAGCLADVMKEYAALGYDGSDLLLALDENYSKTPFFAMDSEELMKSDQTSNVRRSFNSPFYPFVLVTTSIGAEGLDYHQYCNRLVHYTKPSDVVALEQKNGRIDRYESLAQRRWWASPGNRFLLSHEFNERKNASGEMVPKWDAGEGNLHYYFLYTRYTSEENALEELFSEQKKYRRRIGVNGVVDPDSLNLCPYLRRKP